MKITVALVLLCLCLPLTILRAQPAGGAPGAASVAQIDLAKTGTLIAARSRADLGRVDASG